MKLILRDMMKFSFNLPVILVTNLSKEKVDLKNKTGDFVEDNKVLLYFLKALTNMEGWQSAQTLSNVNNTVII